MPTSSAETLPDWRLPAGAPDGRKNAELSAGSPLTHARGRADLIVGGADLPDADADVAWRLATPLTVSNRDSPARNTPEADCHVLAEAGAEPGDTTGISPCAPSWVVELTVLTKANGPLTKRIALDAPGCGVISDGSACVMARGHAERLRLAGPADLAAALETMPPDRAIALGRLRSDLPDGTIVVTQRRLSAGIAPAGAIARTREYIAYVPGEPAFALLDFDRKGMTEAISDALTERGGFWPALVRAVPGLVQAAWVRRASTSAGLFDQRTGAPRGAGAGGEHVYLLVQDGSDIERFLYDLHEQCWLHGLGWFLVGSAGQLLDRSMVDRMVGAPERLVFEGAPVLIEPLRQDLTARVPEWTAGEAIDTRTACPPLTPVERARVAELKEAARAALEPEAAKVRAAADLALAERWAERHGVALPRALRLATARHGGVLLPHVELAFDDAEIGTVTVAEVLADPARFEGETLADPLEGVAYGRGKAKVMRRTHGSLWIHSFAHGRGVYELKFDGAAIEVALRSTDPAAVTDTYVRLLLEAQLEPDEEAQLAELVRDISGLKPRVLTARVRAAHQRRKIEIAAEQHWADIRARMETRRGRDRRTRLLAPLKDAERTPVLHAVDEVLSAVNETEPPMRNTEGAVVEIRIRRPWELHELNYVGANGEDRPRQKLPAPEEPLITPLDAHGLNLLVERHIEHYRVSNGRERAVALPEPFLHAYRTWQDGRLPTVRAVVTAPLITRDGTLLAGTGLDRTREIFFQIEPELLSLVPADPEVIADAQVVEAVRFLVDEWLCDVATDFAGRLVLIAAALTIIERVVLPGRPAFFVTAGQRGGGKTTVVEMLAMAVLGRRPPAAAWSPAPEERRKALLAYLAEGVATLVWDNIERGTTISCPSIEKALTAAEYVDRVLGSSRSATVPSTTVMVFTGNNIAPRGDMSSRSLICRLEIDRPDPENRTFHHPDPLAWTLQNRGPVLKALYTLLRWNPQVRAPHAERIPSQTRFKPWWDLVGAPLEVASMLAVEMQAAAVKRGGTMFDCAPEAVDFAAMFAAGEAEEEETSGMRELVLLLHSVFGERLFSAADLSARLQPPPPTFPPHPEDEQQYALLRAALEGATGKVLPPGAAATPRAIGKRLQMVVGRPVALGDGRVGVIARARTSHDANGYRVTIGQ